MEVKIKDTEGKKGVINDLWEDELAMIELQCAFLLDEKEFKGLELSLQSSPTEHFFFKRRVSNANASAKG